MPVVFDNSELIPAPFVTINKVYLRDAGNNKLSPEYTFTLKGVIVNVGTNKDSPNAGTDGMEGILAEQKRIRELFSIDGGRLEIEAPDGGGPSTIDAYCTVESVDFDPGTWYNRCDYTIVLKARQIATDQEEYEELNSISENWNITENEDGSYSIVHELSAEGALIYSVSGLNNPLLVAKNWCRDRSYSNNSSGVLTPYNNDTIDFTTILNPISDNNFWNFSVVESIGNTQYSWQLSESFIHVPSGNTIEEFGVTINYNSEDLRFGNISVNGSVIGFAERNKNRQEKVNNAKNKFLSTVEPNIYTRLSSYLPSGYIVRTIPTLKQISYEDTAGAVRYNYNYAIASGTIIPNAIEETITVNNTGPTDIFASIAVPNRSNGPIIQNMNTTTSPERVVSIAASLNSSVDFSSIASLAAIYNNKPNTDSIIDVLKPSNGYYYIKQDNEDWNPIRGQYNRVVSWVIDANGTAISGIPSAPNNLRN